MLPEGEETPEEIEYLAASPDEAAMVQAAKHFGFFFYRWGVRLNADRKPIFFFFFFFGFFFFFFFLLVVSFT